MKFFSKIVAQVCVIFFLMLIRNSFATEIQFERITNQLFTDFDSPNVKIKFTPGFERVAKMALKKACIPEKASFIFLEKPEWNSFCTRIGITSPVEINFETQMLVIVSTGIHNTGGYSIKITSISEKEGMMVVDYDIQSPKSGAIITQAFTCTFDAVVIPKTNKKFVFKVN